MVLDEDALEAMLKRQKEHADRDGSKESEQTELTDQTEDFEVYERPGAENATGPGLRSADPEPEPQPEPEPEVEEPAPVHEEPAKRPEPEPTPTPEPEPEPELTPVEEDGPEDASADEDDVPERPRVWPPLSGGHKDDAPKQAPTQEPVHEEPPRPDSTPEPRPEPTPTPEPEPEPQPDPGPAAASEAPSGPSPGIQEAESADPHAHAHADVDVDGGGIRIAVVQALFNQDITDMMSDLAIAKAKKRGAKVTHHVEVPGVYDLPLITKRLLEQDDVDCAVVIGVVVQGETAHDELITHATARTLQQVSLDTGKPIGLGITGPGMTWKQAEARVANGAHAVDAALAQVELMRNA